MKNDSLLSFAVQVAITSNDFDIIKSKEKITKHLPINFIGNIYNKDDNNNSFLVFDIDEILSKSTIPVLKNAIVLFGYLGNPTANSFDIEDKYFSPLNSKFAGKTIPDMHGVVIHANVISMIMNKGFLKIFPKFFTYLLAFFISFYVILFAMKIYNKNTFIYAISIKAYQLIFSIIIVFIAFALLNWNIYINILPILVFTLLGLEMIGYYVHLLKYLKKRFKWKSQLLDY